MKTPPRLLAIETSSPQLSLAVGTDTALVREYRGPLQWRHAESLLEGMQRLLKQARWPVQTLTGVIVSIGPGSFTGIRIGLAAARALGQGLKIPVVGVPSLETLALSQLKGEHRVCSLINALRGDVFSGFYERVASGRPKAIWRENRLPLAGLQGQLRAWRDAPVIFTGDAADAFRTELKRSGAKRWRVVPAYPQAADLLILGRARLSKAAPGNYGKVMPLYLRSAAADERRVRK